MTDAQRETEVLRLREELEDWRAIATEAVLAKECASRLERTIAIDPASLNWEHERTLEENRSLRNCVAGLQDDLRFANRQVSKALNGEITALRTLEQMVRARDDPSKKWIEDRSARLKHNQNLVCAWIEDFARFLETSNPEEAATLTKAARHVKDMPHYFAEPNGDEG